MEKICYLDYDGVLHDENVLVHPKHGIYMGSSDCSLFQWSPILEKLLEPHPDVKIVLSTSWVRVRSFAYAREQLSPSLQQRVIGATYHHRLMAGSDFSEISRGVQIEADVFRRTPQSWFAIDDDDGGWPERCRDKLVRTDGSLGISDPQIQSAIRGVLERL